MTPGEPRLTELALIRALRERARQSAGVRVGIGDDCAVLESPGGGLLLATTDLLIEDVHFRRRYAEPADIGWKALAVNVSDIASMGGRPRWALVALACPEGTTMDEVEAFYEGVHALGDEHQVAVVGGDTSASPSGWVINITLLGEATGRPVLRSGARAGDVVAVTGDLGRSAAGLAVLERREAPARVSADALAAVTAAHLRPRPRVKEGQWLAAAGGVTAMIDLSDGLATDLRHIADESRVGARVDVGQVPIAEATRTVARATKHDAVAWATGGGEDYELLLTCEPSALERLQTGLLGATGTTLTAVGAVDPDGPNVTFIDADGRAVDVGPGFEHFTSGARRE
ncbi:MAG: thiamine-phosphate kinase [Candidatus Rokuibacteriota bacterium]|nr:MAG: thiamine-phosphate kinase [Candidatus Rokubacteria bacterium]